MHEGARPLPAGGAGPVRTGDRPSGAVPAIPFTLDGRPVRAEPGESILQAADRHGIPIPRLCHMQRRRPESRQARVEAAEDARLAGRWDGNCRACVVEIEGERSLAPACARAPRRGMVVRASSGRARMSQRLVLELLLSEIRADLDSRDAELDFWARELGVGSPRFAWPATAAGPAPKPDLSHPAIAVRLDACIRCARCIRACREVQGNDVIGYAGRGDHASIVFDLGDPLGLSTCVACGQCVDACPTGAILDASGTARAADRALATVCPHCGVGCQLTYHAGGDRIIGATARDGPSNHRRLCVHGRYGFDAAGRQDRLLVPLVRREDAPRGPDGLPDPVHPEDIFREATWEEATDLAAAGLRRVRDRYGPSALAALGDAAASNEEAYLLQKLARTAFGTNNVDHWARPPGAPGARALLEMLGSAAGTNPVEDVASADVALVVGSDTTVSHPVAATFIRNAVDAGTHLIVIDPAWPEIARRATLHLRLAPGTDVAALNALAAAIVEEGLADERFIAERTEGFDALHRHLAAYRPEAVAPVCGVPAVTLREAARLYASAGRAMIFWGTGVSRHGNGADGERCLVNLALLTGHIGRRGAGLHPLQGGANTQGASDVGLLAALLPDRRRIDDADARARLEALWGRPLDPSPGLDAAEMMDAATRGTIRGMYLMGDAPAVSQADAETVPRALASLDWLVSQGTFLTAATLLADVVLPAAAHPEKWGTYTNTDRRVQIGRPVLDLPGNAREGWWILREIANRLGCGWSYAGPWDVFDELRRAVPAYAGITWERLDRDGAATSPWPEGRESGVEVLFTDRFATATGRGRFAVVAAPALDRIAESAAARHVLLSRWYNPPR